MRTPVESTTDTNLSHPRTRDRRRNEKLEVDFSSVSPDIAKLIAMRDKLMLDAFRSLEQCHPLLADMLVYRTGSRTNAARWMCKRLESFHSLTAYDVIADGDMDTVWDEVVSP